MRHATKLHVACLTLAVFIALGLLVLYPIPSRAQLGSNAPQAESDSCASGLSTFAQGLCIITLSNATGSPVADGTVIVDLLEPSNVALLGCDGPPTAPATSSCLVTHNGTEVDLPCGATAPTGTVPSVTCSTVSFTIESALGACISSPTTSCPPIANLSGGGAAVTVSFLATPGNAGTSGVLLGTDAISFQGANLGTLLVSATPASLPSNGTVGAIVTATFACNTVTNQLTSTGFPLSSSGFEHLRTTSLTIVNQPVLGTGQSAVCGAGLPGGFTFTAPRNILFDNGRTSEGIGCGLGPTTSPFGGQSAFPPYGSTTPLVFTCTGAAVMAASNGNAGDAPINVTYQSAVGGLEAVGSTLLTVVPAQTPIVSVSCSPQTIAAGGPGSLCTATVTDQNMLPLSGLSGATVTWSAAGATTADVFACGIGTVNPITLTTAPPTAPQLSPTTPCQTPSPSFAAQNSTAVNGQATALVSVPAGSSAGSETISATLAVEIPPSAACLAAPYLPSPFLAAQLGAPAVSGCGSGNPVGFTGTAAALSPVTGGLTSPASYTPFEAPSGSQAITITAGTGGFLIAGATAATPLPLTAGVGCNDVVVTGTAGTPMASLAALVSPQSALVAIWRFDNHTKQYQAGYFSDSMAPTDFATTGQTTPALQGSRTINTPPPPNGSQLSEGYWVCVSQPATISAG